MKRHLSKGGKFATFFLLAIMLLAGCQKAEPLEINPFESIDISYSGWNGSGKAEVSGSVPYSGKNETVKKLLDSLTYSIQPTNKNLSNGDELTVSIEYKKDLKELANVTFLKEEKKFTVQGLAEDTRQAVVDKKTVTDEEGNESSVWIENYVTDDGTVIPGEWGLNEEEAQAYLQYKQNSEANDEPANEPGIQIEWIQGESDIVTHRKNATYYCEDFLNNQITTYDQAYKYGIESSQEFKIDPIIKNEKTIGYRCIFKE